MLAAWAQAEETLQQLVQGTASCSYPANPIGGLSLLKLCELGAVGSSDCGTTRSREVLALTWHPK